MKIIKRCKTCHVKFVPALKVNGNIEPDEDRKKCFRCLRPANDYALLITEKEYKSFLKKNISRPFKKTKVCQKCKNDLPLTLEFYLFNKTTNKFRTNCKKCSGENNKQRQTKQMAVDYKGGSCNRCGYNKCLAALEFHHTNPNEKEGDVSKYQRFNENLKLELDKCELVCANCHREIHYNLRNPSDSNFDQSKSPL